MLLSVKILRKWTFFFTLETWEMIHEHFLITSTWMWYVANKESKLSVGNIIALYEIFPLIKDCFSFIWYGETVVLNLFLGHPRNKKFSM